MDRNEAARIQKLVVMGASAGGIDALRKVLSDLPADFPTPIVIVQHLMEKPEVTRLPEILSRQGRIPVVLAQDQMVMERGVAYVAQPGKHLKVNRSRLMLDLGKPVRFVRPSVDVLFTSAAAGFGAALLGVVLTGIGSDGTEGCRRIKAGGGVTLAQDPATADFPDMPEAAIKAGAVDLVAPLAEIAGHIQTWLEAE